MSEQQQREACAELARRMGYTVKVISGKFGLWRCYKPNGESQSVCAHTSESQAWFSAPDYFTDAAASWELRLWLASDDDHWRKFTYELFGKAEVKGWDYVRAGMTAEPSAIARAACKALGIEVSE